MPIKLATPNKANVERYNKQPTTTFNQVVANRARVMGGDAYNEKVRKGSVLQGQKIDNFRNPSGFGVMVRNGKLVMNPNATTFMKPDNYTD